MEHSNWEATIITLGKQLTFAITTSSRNVPYLVGRLGQTLSGGVERPHVERPFTRVVNGHQNTSSVERQRNNFASICNYYLRRLLLLANDVETNPGPTIQISTHNVSGMRNLDKCRRILNNANKLNKGEIQVIGLQETHLDDTHVNRLNHQWRLQHIMSPSEGNAKGTLLLYDERNFESITVKESDPEGRWTIIVASKSDTTYLFCSVYGPNQRHHAFFSRLTDHLSNLIATHQVNEVFILGDLNINYLKDNHHNADKRNAAALIKDFIYTNRLATLSNFKSHTWQRGSNTSTLDFIIGPKHLEHLTKSNVKWGKEISDHAQVTISITPITKAKSNIPRINTEFTEDDTLSDLFRNELERIISQSTNIEGWNPHQKLDFVKMAIRTAANYTEGIYKSKFNKDLENSQSHLDRLHEELENTIDVNERNTLSQRIETEKAKNDDLLARRGKYLASRARLNWIEKGEKNNKYFMNLIKANNAKQAINELIVDGVTTNNQDEFPRHIHNFYDQLYNNPGDNQHIDEFLDSIETKQITDEDNYNLTKPITLKELTLTLRSSSGTTPGPDGIGNQVYKICWDLVGTFIVEAWNYSIATGQLPESQRSSMICLLEKKGKDRRIINNLRPITLSNCDLKLITKTYTTRMNSIVNKILGPEQTAYLPGRQVHDNLRTIDLCKAKCHSTRTQGYLTSLDAKKAYDSVSHEFITKTLNKFGFNRDFQNIFETLYKNINTRVNVNGTLTEPISIKRGVKQGDALSCTLFILCMETVIIKIKTNNRVNPITINNINYPKVIAYADDIALLTDSRRSTIQALKTYEKFSRASGLFLNAEKTEIVNLTNYIRNEYIQTNIYNHPVNVTMVEKLVICGKAFSLNNRIETEMNIDNKILKLDKAITAWKKRNLTLEGRIIVAKTFAISQVIYMMQNTFFPKQALKTIESKIFKYIWKGPDQIKRATLIQTFDKGGMKAPSPTLINDTLKLKQLLRTSQTDHPIKNIVKNQFDLSQPFTTNQSDDPFTKQGIEVFNRTGEKTIQELINDLPANQRAENNVFKVSKKQKVRIGNFNIPVTAQIARLNPIERAYLINATRTLQIDNLAQLHEATQNEISRNYPIINNTINKLHPKLRALCEDNLLRITTSETIDEMLERKNTINLGTNLFKLTRQVTTLDVIRLESPNGENLLNPNPNPNPFIINRNLLHPKEKTAQFLALHNKTFTNDRLFRHRMRDSPYCATCHEVETLDHIIHRCPRATATWTCFEEVTGIRLAVDIINQGVPDKWLNNLISLIRTRLLYRRDQEVNLEELKIQIENRQSDIGTIRTHKDNFKTMCIKKKRIISQQ